MTNTNYFKKYAVLILLVISFLAGTYSQFIRIKSHKENDHWVYYRTAQRMANKDIQHIYSRDDGALPFRYSPASVMLFSWMSHFDEMTSRQIWLIIQASFILAGLYYLYKILFQLQSPHAFNSVVFSFFLFYRYFLDALFCGQIAGVIFFCLVLAMYHWINDRKNLSNQFLLLLFLLKIIPGFIIAINFLSVKSWKEFIKLATMFFLSLLIIHSVYYFWFGIKFGFINSSDFFSTFKDWINIAGADRNYFDGSTSKSQALRGVILRLFGNYNSSELLWRVTTFCSVIGLYSFWYNLKMKSEKIRTYAFLLGVLAFVLFMPQSLPYQILKLLIPTVFLMSEFLIKRTKQLTVFFVLIFIFCTIPTSDIVGASLANHIQYYSLPFLVFIFMGIILFQRIFKLQKETQKPAELQA